MNSRLRLFALLSAATLVSAKARADSFAYNFVGFTPNDAFTYTSPVLITTDTFFVPTTCGNGDNCIVEVDPPSDATAYGSIKVNDISKGLLYGQGLHLDFFSVGTHAENNTTITISDVPSSVTPEPSSLVLLGTGIAGLVGAARRRYWRV